ncbi:MAG: amidase, partial [Arenicellales bacterium]
MFHEHSLIALRDLLRRREVSSTELTRHCLDRIDGHRDLNAFITIDEAGAMVAATAADEKLARGEHGPLTGFPNAHKDIFCTKGMLTTCGSKMLGNFVSPYDATVVERLADAGSVLVGKTNMDEFAMGSSNETSFFGTVKNPW